MDELYEKSTEKPTKTKALEGVFRYLLQVGYNWGRTSYIEKKPYDHDFGRNFDLLGLRKPEVETIRTLLDAAMQTSEGADADASIKEFFDLFVESHVYWTNGARSAFDWAKSRGLIQSGAGLWQPIEAAPKDGTQFLVSNGECVVMATWPNDAIDVFDVTDHRIFENYPPTHWTPLPEPPTAAIEARYEGNKGWCVMKGYGSMHDQKVKSFKILDKVIELYEDDEGKELAIVLPKWMFNQIVEKAFKGVKVKTEAMKQGE